MDQIYFCQYSEYFADSSPESDGCRPAPWLWNPDPPQWWPLYIFFTWIGWMSFCPLAEEPRPSTVVTSVYLFTWIGWMSSCPLAEDPRPSTGVTSVYLFTWIEWMSSCPLAEEPRPSTVVTSAYLFTWIGWMSSCPLAEDPRPSTVVTSVPWRLQSWRQHAVRLTRSTRPPVHLKVWFFPS